jgi:TP901 family phage tail tape measure protein
VADVTRSIDIIFGAVDNTGSAVSGVAGQIDKLEGQATDVAEPLAKVAEKVLALETALGVLAAGGMAVATAKASEFGLSFAEISTLIDKPKEALGQFKDDILAYAQNSTQSVSQITGALYEGISAGLKYEDSIKFVGDAERLAVGSKADLTETTKTLISTLNAYGESTDQAGKYSDILFQAIKVGQTTMPELSSSLAQVTGLAASGKVPFETLAAAIAALTASGLPTSEAITGIKAALSNIIKPTEQAKDMAAQLGIKFDATALATKGFDGVLQDVYKATGGNISKMAELFGSTEALNAVMVLASDKAGKFKEALDSMKTSSGSTAEAYAKMKDEFKNVSQELVNNLDVALIKIGDKFIPGLTQIEGGLRDIFKSIATSVDAGAFDPLFNVIDKFGKSLGDELKTIGANLPAALKGIDYSELIQSVSGLGTSIAQAFNAIFNGIDLSTPEGLTAAIQRVVDGITALTNVTAGILDAWKPFLTILGQAIDYFVNLDAATLKNIGEILGWAQQIAAAATGFGILTAAITLAGSGISAFGSLGSTAVSVFTTMGSAMGLTSTALTTLTLAAAAFATGWEIGKILYDNIPLVKDYGDNLGAVIYNMTHWGDETTKTTAAAEAQAVAAKALADKVAELSKKYSEVPDEKTIEIEAKGLQDVIDNARQLGLTIEDVPREKLIELMVKSDVEKAAEINAALDQIAKTRVGVITTELDQASIDKAYAERQAKIPDSQKVTITTLADGTTLLECKGQIDKSIPDKKEVQVEAKVVAESLEKIVTSFNDLTKTKIEWASKLEIAELEADTKRIEAAFGSINEGIKSTGDVLGSLFDLMKEVDSSPNLEPSRIERWIEREYELREQEFELQKELVTAQVQSMNARTQALLNGDGLIKVSADGMAPELESVLYSFVKQLQVKVSQAGGDMLIGAK